MTFAPRPSSLDAAARPPRRRRPYPWRRTLWSLLYPKRAQRVAPTVSGVLLVTLALSIGVAAYNSSNNILFITLSLLLSCLILSGVLSWLNLARVSWQLSATPPFRVGQTATAAVALRNDKRLVPTYGLWFDLTTTPAVAGARLALRERLDAAGGEARLEWSFRPVRRGRQRVELRSVGSLFPFGFLRKALPTELHQEIIVWPAPVAYERFIVSTPSRPLSGEQVARVGQSGDLLALRRYAPGDSHRLIHWKASARLRTLMVRQFASETQEAFALRLETPPGRWPREEQFELLIAFATSLAEDLFTAGRLGSVALDTEAARPVRRLRDLEEFLDRVAQLDHREVEAARPSGAPPARRAGLRLPRPNRNLLTFGPEGLRNVIAYVDGHKAAAA